MLYNETILGMSDSKSSLVSTKELRQQPPKGTVHIPQCLIHTLQKNSNKAFKQKFGTRMCLLDANTHLCLCYTIHPLCVSTSGWRGKCPRVHPGQLANL